VISVVVPVLDAMPWLEAQIQALVAQDCDEAWEIVIADNGSSDGSIELAEKWAVAFPMLRVVEASGVQGPGAARNAGARSAKGDLLAFCDADDVVRPGWLDACVRALSEFDLVGGVVDFWSLNGIESPTPPIPVDPPAYRQFGFLEAAMSSNFAIHRKAFEAVGGFAEDLMVGEDTDLCWRLQLKGYRFGLAHDAVIAKRERYGFAKTLRRYIDYGACGPDLYKRFRSDGLQREARIAAKSWVWLALRVPTLIRPEHRLAWARIAGWRSGRLLESVKQGVFFP
jgi:glycosyltransferase involved in cell wall biosynthesis